MCTDREFDSEDREDREMTSMIGSLASALRGMRSTEGSTDTDPELAEMARLLGEALFVDQRKPGGLTDDQQMALVVTADGAGKRVVYTDLDSLMNSWARHLGADTTRLSAGVVALATSDRMVMWARTWEPGEYDLDTLEPNTVAGFIWWMNNEHHHLPIFGPVMLTGMPNDSNVDGLGALDLAALEEAVESDAHQDDDELVQRAELSERFREAARAGQMFQDAGNLARVHPLPADPSMN